jgi:type IV secretory pathway VirJ component
VSFGDRHQSVPLRSFTSAVSTALLLACIGAHAATAPKAAPHKTPGGGSKSGASGTPAPGSREEQIKVPLFGSVSVYRPDPIEKTRGVILFVSGDGGWNKGVVDMARRTAGKAIVVGLSMPQWQKMAEASPAKCWYPAGELETIAQSVEKQYRLPVYLRPILVGYSSGATVIYGALAQGPAETFAGGVSLGFCPDLEVARPFCGRGDWKPTYEPKKHMGWLPERADLATRAEGTPRWTALQGDVDQVCDPVATKKFVDDIPAAKLVWLPKVGHGFSVPRNWAADYDAAIEALLQKTSAFEAAPAIEPAPAGASAAHAVAPAEIEARLSALGLPLEILWPEVTGDSPVKNAVIFVSGDGGWAELDREVSERLVHEGIAVIGWNTLRYFWVAKPPEKFRSDLERVIAALPADMRVFAGGYSFGAEVVPVVSALKTPPLLKLAGLVLVGPGEYATFEVSPLDWIRTDTNPTSFPVAKALGGEGAIPALCLESQDGEDSGCPKTPVAGVTRLEMAGGHHFSGDYGSIAEKIAVFVNRTP